MSLEKGYVHLYTGNGKGRTPAASGPADANSIKQIGRASGHHGGKRWIQRLSEKLSVNANFSAGSLMKS
jgi:hypothetical protein